MWLHHSNNQKTKYNRPLYLELGLSDQLGKSCACGLFLFLMLLLEYWSKLFDTNLLSTYLSLSPDVIYLARVIFTSIFTSRHQLVSPIALYLRILQMYCWLFSLISAEDIARWRIFVQPRLNTRRAESCHFMSTKWQTHSGHRSTTVMYEFSNIVCAHNQFDI